VLIFIPVSKVTVLVAPETVFPFIAGGASTTFNSIFVGILILIGFSSRKIIETSLSLYGVVKLPA